MVLAELLEPAVQIADVGRGPDDALAIELDSVAWCQHLGEWLEEQAIIWADEEDEETRALLEVLSLVRARREESLWRVLSER